MTSRPVVLDFDLNDELCRDADPSRADMLKIVAAAPSLNVAARCAAPRMGFAPSPKELSNDPTIKETLAAAAVERAEREARARNIKSEALPFMVSFIDFRKSTARV